MQTGNALPRRATYYTLRIAAAMCFIGHGAFGLITKKIWLNYFAVVGIGPELGWQLMPIVGTIDVLLGISLLVYPTRAAFGWLVFWGMWTALLRPLSGEPFAETVERAGNFGAPLAMLFLCGVSRNPADWFRRLGADISPLSEDALQRLRWCLRVIVFLLLAGHGTLNLLEKKTILAQYAALQVSNPVQLAHLVGAFEVIAAFGVLIRPIRPVLIGLLLWKMATEMFYPLYGLLEWVERGGSYGTIFALWLVLPQRATSLVGSPQPLRG